MMVTFPDKEMDKGVARSVVERDAQSVVSSGLVATS